MIWHSIFRVIKQIACWIAESRINEMRGFVRAYVADRKNKGVDRIIGFMIQMYMEK